MRIRRDVSRAKKIVEQTKKFCIDTTFGYPFVIKTGSGCFLEDVDGVRYLDFNSNVASCNVGYNHPEIMKVLKEFAKLGTHKIAGQDFFCSPKGTLIVGKEVKPIERVKTGDMVFTHKGRLGKVTNVYKRYYKGRLIKIIPHGNRPILFTPNHPVLVKGLTKVKAKNSDPGGGVRYKKQWRKAEKIIKQKFKNRGDLLHTPVLLKNPKRNLGTIKIRKRKGHRGFEKFILNPDRMRFIGYYLAEGHVHQGRVIVFTFNRKEKEFVEDVKRIASEEFQATSSEKLRGNARIVEVFSATIAEPFKKWFGDSASTKKIPTEILLLKDTSLLKEIVKGYWRGDGTLKSKEFTVFTISPSLAHHLRLILAKLGIFLSIYEKKRSIAVIEGRKIRGKAGFSLYIPHKFRKKFGRFVGQDVEEIEENLPFPRSKKYTKYIKETIDNKWRKHFWVRARRIEEVPFEGYVYNLEIENDNSFLAEGFSVHNCNEQAELAKKLVKITPRNLSRVLFTNSGAEAVENAIKFCYRKHGPLAGVSCIRAFHGRTIGALSFTDSKAVQKRNYPEVNNELIKFCTNDNDPSINQLDELIKREAEPAFVIVECVQGEGGYRPASKKFIQTLRKVTKKYHVPLIIDDIQAGMGRTGKWWSFEHYKIKPDIMTAGKSLQVGAVVSSKYYDPHEPGAVSSTWGGGHRIDMAVGLKTIEIIEKEKLMENATRMGKYFMKWLEDLKERYPEEIVDVRGLGLMIGVQFTNEKKRDLVVQRAFKEGLLLLGCGFRTIRIAPPLIITKEESDRGLFIFDKLVKELK